MRLITRDTVNSTMDEARQLVASGEAVPFAVSAAVQTGGRGRHGRQWASPKGGVWLTVVHHLPHGDRRVGTLPLAVGLAVARRIERICRLPERTVQLKWPNDLLVSGSKCAGVLCEREIHPNADADDPMGSTVYVGVGINASIDPDRLPSGLRYPATSLSSMASDPVDPTALAAEIAHTLSLESLLIDATEVIDGVRERLAMLGERVCFERSSGTQEEAKLIGIDLNGAVVLEDDLGEQVSHHAGEIRGLRVVGPARPIPRERGSGDVE
ncbi:MAG: biotin--[acetyl-CoA-carboxylase] ligase [Planctomycetota bacterium]